MKNSICILFFILFQYLHSFSQESSYVSIVELSFDWNCDEYATEIPNGRTGNFRKSDFLRLWIGRNEVIFQKVQHFNDFDNDSNYTTVRFKSVRLFNFPVELFHINNLEIIQRESLVPFITSESDVSGKSKPDTFRITHSCKALLRINSGSLSITKEIDTDFLRKEDLIPIRPNLTIVENLSFDHNRNLIHIKIYELLLRISENISEQNGYEVE